MWWYKVAVLVFVCMLLPSVAAATAPAAADGEEYIVIWGSFGPADTESVHPYGIAVDAAGNICVDDPENGRVRTYSTGAGISPADESTLAGVSSAGNIAISEIPAVLANEWTVGPGTDDDFTTIQDAIDAASDGDTIIIGSGTYKEDIVVNKPLFLDGGYDAAIDGKITLTADGSTLIGCMVVYGVWVESDDNTLEGVLAGWWVSGADWGRDGFIVRGSHNTFTDCIVDGYYLGPAATGMIIDGTTGNTFTRSGVIDSCIGAHLIDSTHTTFQKCIFFARGDGFILDGSLHTTFIDCAIANTDYMERGVYLGGSGSVFTNCQICGGEYGVLLDASRMNVFTGCTISGQRCGVYQGMACENNIFTRCTVLGLSADWCGFAFFADAALEGAVREALGIPEGDIPAEDMRNLAVLFVPDRGIRSLSGLEYAASLQELNIDTSHVSDLWPLAHLTSLRRLVLSHNGIRDLTPLVANSDAGGLGPGDVVDLRYNGLDLTPGSAAMTAIGTLEAGGAIVLYEPQDTVPVLSADFTADVTEGATPLKVTFTDRSTGGPEEWFWEFGDGTTSTEQHPVHTYTAVGTCTVCLTIRNADGCDTAECNDYICVHAAPPTPVDEFPVGGEVLVMGMVCGILGVAGVFSRKMDPR